MTDMDSRTRAAGGSGAIVLAHDGIGPGAKRTDVRETIAYTRLVAEHAIEAGLELGTVE